MVVVGLVVVVVVINYSSKSVGNLWSVTNNCRYGELIRFNLNLKFICQELCCLRFLLFWVAEEEGSFLVVCGWWDQPEASFNRSPRILSHLLSHCNVLFDKTNINTYSSGIDDTTGTDADASIQSHDGSRMLYNYATIWKHSLGYLGRQIANIRDKLHFHSYLWDAPGRCVLMTAWWCSQVLSGVSKRFFITQQHVAANQCVMEQDGKRFVCALRIERLTKAFALDRRHRWIDATFPGRWMG